MTVRTKERPPLLWEHQPRNLTHPPIDAWHVNQLLIVQVVGSAATHIEFSLLMIESSNITINIIIPTHDPNKFREYFWKKNHDPMILAEL